MTEPPAPKTPALRDMYWRSEILQVCYWLRGEGLGDTVDAALLERFLGVGATIGITYLDRLVSDGYLEREGSRYRLSALGVEEGKAEFALSFAELTRPGHGECSADCWCHASAEEAVACATQRAGHAP
jgi:hypothetical protein